MQPCRFKVRDRSNDWKCCFCCHVRTGTIFFGIWHLMLHVLALSVLAVVLRHPELMTYDNDNGIQLPVEHPSPTQGPHSGSQILGSFNLLRKESDEPPMEFNGDSTLAEKPTILIHSNSFTNRAIYYRDVNNCVVFTFCTFMITLLMVYGAIKGKPFYLLPFFCLQVFDFCLSSLSAVGYLMYMPDVHGLVAHCPRIPYQRELLQLSEQCLALLVLLTFIVALLVKAYFIGVVWSCYKYLMLRILPGPATVHYIDTESLLPSYEAAVKKFPTPPPSYATAVRQSAQPPPAATTTAGDNPPPQPM